mmetsp:Transcript_21830/g.27019  ORF Transcript_21830/g.27019 Transcript_21830/m.27019 type:complete len:268 (+) Transcript_21830:1640-2443(+)
MKESTSILSSATFFTSGNLGALPQISFNSSINKSSSFKTCAIIGIFARASFVIKPSASQLLSKIDSNTSSAKPDDSSLPISPVLTSAPDAVCFVSSFDGTTFVASPLCSLPPSSTSSSNKSSISRYICTNESTSIRSFAAPSTSGNFGAAFQNSFSSSTKRSSSSNNLAIMGIAIKPSFVINPSSSHIVPNNDCNASPSLAFIISTCCCCCLSSPELFFFVFVISSCGKFILPRRRYWQATSDDETIRRCGRKKEGCVRDNVVATPF